MEGHLELCLMRGEDLANVERFGKQDPYAVLTVGSRSVRSTTHTDGGKHPVRARTRGGGFSLSFPLGAGQSTGWRRFRPAGQPRREGKPASGAAAVGEQHHC